MRASIVKLCTLLRDIYLAADVTEAVSGTVDIYSPCARLKWRLCAEVLPVR